MIRLLWCLFAAVQSPLMFWLGGFDFEVRDKNMVACYWIALLFFALANSYPGAYPGEKT